MKISLVKSSEKARVLTWDDMEIETPLSLPLYSFVLTSMAGDVTSAEVTYYIDGVKEADKIIEDLKTSCYTFWISEFWIVEEHGHKYLKTRQILEKQ